MKTTTKKELIEFLENHYLNEDYTLIDLFKNFYKYFILFCKLFDFCTAYR